MHPMRAALVAALVYPAAGRAHDLRDEIGAGAMQATSTRPATSYISDRLTATFALSDDWDVRIFGRYLRWRVAESPRTRTTFSDSNSDAFSGGLGLTYRASDQLTLDAQASGSPSSTVLSSTPVQYTGLRGGVVDADAARAVRSASYGASLSADLDLDDSAEVLDLDFALSVAAVHYDTDEDVTALARKNGTVVAADRLRSECRNRVCASDLVALLEPQRARFGQLALTAGITATLLRDTDLTTEATLFLYDGDPTRLGDFRAAALGSGSGVGGIVAPLRYSLLGEALHQLGPLQLLGLLDYGAYVNGRGWNLTAGVRAQLKVGASLRLWLAGNGQRDVDDRAEVAYGLALTLGARYRF